MADEGNEFHQKAEQQQARRRIAAKIVERDQRGERTLQGLSDAGDLVRTTNEQRDPHDIAVDLDGDRG